MSSRRLDQSEDQGSFKTNEEEPTEIGNRLALYCDHCVAVMWRNISAACHVHLSNLRGIARLSRDVFYMLAICSVANRTLLAVCGIQEDQVLGATSRVLVKTHFCRECCG